MVKTMTNYEISNIMGYVNQPDSLFNKTDVHMSMTFAWRLRKNIQRIASLNDMFETARAELMNSYATEELSYEKDGERYVKDEYIPEYMAKMNDLLNQENEVRIETVTFDEITPDPEHFEVTYAEMDTLSFMIEDNDMDDFEDEIEVVEDEIISEEE